MNTVSFTILERKQEIGNLRANGESILEVMQLLLIEAASLGFLGALLGILIAYFLNTTLFEDGVPMPPAPGLTRQYAVRMELQVSFAFIVVGLGIAASLVSSLIAGLKVARTPIAEALRST